MKVRISRILLLLAGGAAAVELLARLNVRREQAARRYLGDKLYTRLLGAGDPLVFLPGYQGSTEFWQHAFDPLASRYRLIFVDALGFGRSPWPDTPPTLEDHLGALRRTLLAQKATRRVTLVAHSFGTLLAAYYGERYPDEVDRLFLLGTPVFADEDDARRRLHEISPIGALLTQPLPGTRSVHDDVRLPSSPRSGSAAPRSRPPPRGGPRLCPPLLAGR